MALTSQPVEHQQKTRIAIALYAMQRAMAWYRWEVFREEPEFQSMAFRLNKSIDRCLLWYAKENIQPTNKLSVKTLKIATAFIDKKFYMVSQTKHHDIAFFSAIFLEMASMALHDAVISCTYYRYRPLKWAYICSQKILTWMYEMFGESIYNSGYEWYFSLAQKIGRR